MKITDLIDELTALAAVNPNLIVVARVYSDYRPINKPELHQLYSQQNDTYYTNGHFSRGTEKQVLVIEG